MIKSKVREQYRGLSRQELLDKVYELGFNYELKCMSCSQCSLKAIHELVEMDDSVVRTATSSCGGQHSLVQGTCGALIGGTMAIDYFFGRPAEHLSPTERNEDWRSEVWVAIKTARPLYDKFLQEWGTGICPQLQSKVLGRTYYFWDQEELDKFFASGGAKDPDKCSHIVGSAARWALEMLLDKGAIELG